MPYIGNTNTTQAFTPAVDFFNGNGSTTAFTLSRPVASVAQVQAVIENVPQNPGDAFTVSGNTITFTSAPPSGTSNIYVYYTSPITQVIAPSQGTVGTTQIQDSAITTAKIAAGAVIPADLAQPLTSGTAVASTSGTSIDFTGIPSWARRITVMLNGVSTSGFSAYLVQIGAGSFTTSGYSGSAAYGGTPATYSSGFIISSAHSAVTLQSGVVTLVLLGSNIWVQNAIIGLSNASTPTYGGGVLSLGGTLDRVRITTAGGDTFDAGSINIMYE